MWLSGLARESDQRLEKSTHVRLALAAQETFWCVLGLRQNVPRSQWRMAPLGFADAAPYDAIFDAPPAAAARDSPPLLGRASFCVRGGPPGWIPAWQPGEVREYVGQCAEGRSGPCLHSSTRPCLVLPVLCAPAVGRFMLGTPAPNPQSPS